MANILRWFLCRLVLAVAVGPIVTLHASITSQPSTSGSGSVYSTATFVDYDAAANAGAGGWRMRIEATWSGSEPGGNIYGYASFGPFGSPPMGMGQPTSFAGTSPGYAGAGAVLTHSVYIQSLGGVYYATSEQLTAPGAPAQQYKVTVSLFNSRDVAVKYRLMQGATQLGEVELQPGTGLIQTFTTTNPAPVDVLELIPGLTKDGDTWASVDGAVTTRTVATGLVPTLAPTGSPNPPAVPVPPAPDVPNVTKPDPHPPTVPVWKPPTPNNNPANQTDLVTNTVFREGVGKIVQALEHTSQQHDAALKANPIQSQTAAQGQTAGSAVAALYGTVPTALTITSAGAAPLLSVTFPLAFGGKTVDFNPFSNDRFAAICSWFRTATAWLAVILLGGWVWKEIGAWTRGLAGIKQAQGNAVVGGTGAQATAFIAAGLITVALVVAVTALLSWSFGEVGITVIKNTVSTNPLVSIPVGVLWMLDQLFPVSTLIICAVARATFNMYAAPLFATAAAVVRFIVP